MEKITYIVANYNNSEFIGQCITSLLKQTSDRWMCVICDDCSDDDSLSIIYGLVENDERFTVIKNDTRTKYTGTLKKLIDVSTTDIVGVLDSDDALTNDATDEILKSYDNGYKGFVYSNYWHCEIDLIPVRPGYCRKIPDGKSNIQCDCVSHLKTFRRDEYYKTDGYDSEIVYAQDKDLTYKMEEVTELHFINKPLYLHRHKDKGRSTVPYVKISQSNAINRRKDPSYGNRKFNR